MNQERREREAVARDTPKATRFDDVIRAAKHHSRDRYTNSQNNPHRGHEVYAAVYSHNLPKPGNAPNRQVHQGSQECYGDPEDVTPAILSDLVAA